MWLGYIILVSLCLLSVLWNRKSHPQFYLPWAGLLFFTILTEVVKRSIDDEWYTSLITHLYQPIEFFWLILMYSKAIKDHRLKNYRYIWISIYTVIALLLSWFVGNQFTTFNTFSYLLEAVVITFLALYFMYEEYHYGPEDWNLFRQPFFWINTGNLFFFTVTFFHKGLDNYFLDHFPEIAKQSRYIMVFSNYLLYIMYTIGSLCRIRMEHIR